MTTGLNCSLPEDGEVVSFRHWLSKFCLLFPLCLWSLKIEGISPYLHKTFVWLLAGVHTAPWEEKHSPSLNIPHPQQQLRQCKCHGSVLMTWSISDKLSSEREGLFTLHREIWHGWDKGFWWKKHPPSYLLSADCPQILLLGIFTPVRVREGARAQIWEALGKHKGWKQVPYTSWGAEIQFLHGQKNRLNITITQTCRLL